MLWLYNQKGKSLLSNNGGGSLATTLVYFKTRLNTKQTKQIAHNTHTHTQTNINLAR